MNDNNKLAEFYAWDLYENEQGMIENVIRYILRIPKEFKKCGIVATSLIFFRKKVTGCSMYPRRYRKNRFSTWGIPKKMF